MRTLGMFFILLCLAIFFVGCMKGEQSGRLNVAEDVEFVEDLTDEEDELIQDEEQITDDTVTRQLYLLDASGMVVPQHLQLPKIESKEVATQVLQYLVKGGPVTAMLPNGFQAVLPEDTEILSLNLQDDGTLVVDVSEQFKDYDAKDEVSIIESMTYTLTQFDTVERIKLKIEGIEQSEMPVNGTPISAGYSRESGINISDDHINDLINSKAVIMYYPKQYNDQTYFVPVTQYIGENPDNDLSELVHTLIKGPNYETHLRHVFNPLTTLLEEPRLDNGTLELVFNEHILKDTHTGMIANDVVESLVLSLTELELIDKVDIKVKNKHELVNEDGKAYTEPISLNHIRKQDNL